MSNDTSFIAFAFYIIRTLPQRFTVALTHITYAYPCNFLARNFKQSLKAFVILYSAVVCLFYRDVDIFSDIRCLRATLTIGT